MERSKLHRIPIQNELADKLAKLSGKEDYQLFLVNSGAEADAGKNCTGKPDCLGRCLSDAPDNAASIQIGTPVAGRCEANASTFGCYARVEAGKLAESYSCED